MRNTAGQPPSALAAPERRRHERVQRDRDHRDQQHFVEEAAADAIKTAGQHLRELRVAEVVEQDIHLDEGGAITYRTKLQLSFKYVPEH